MKVSPEIVWFHFDGRRGGVAATAEIWQAELASIDRLIDSRLDSEKRNTDDRLIIRVQTNGESGKISKPLSSALQDAVTNVPASEGVAVFLQFTEDQRTINIPLPSQKKEALKSLLEHTNDFTVEETMGGYNVTSAQHEPFYIPTPIFESLSGPSPETPELRKLLGDYFRSNLLDHEAQKSLRDAIKTHVGYIERGLDQSQ